MPEKVDEDSVTNLENGATEAVAESGEAISPPKDGEAVSSTEEEKKIEEEPEDISPNKDRGILKWIIKPGEGVARPDDGVKVRVNYKAKMLDGTVFHNSDEGEPHECELGVGAGMQIKAWDIAIATMKKGEIAKYRIRAKYAYEHFGYPPIVPPNRTIIIEIELATWDNDMTAEKDGGVLKTILVLGEDTHDKPREGCLVEIHCLGEHNGKVFEDRDVLFTLGEGSAYGVCQGIEMGLESFRVNETSKLEIKWKYSKDAAYKLKANLPICAEVVYTITLKSFRKIKNVFGLNMMERLKVAESSKEAGTKYYKEGMYPIAIKMYNRIGEMVGRGEFREEEDQMRQWEVMIAMHLNLALCYLKMGEGKEVIEHCDKVLEKAPSNVKAHFRRGQGHMVLWELDAAVEDFEKVLKVEPYNNAAINNIRRCKIMKKTNRSSEKSFYGSMFHKEEKKNEEGADS